MTDQIDLIDPIERDGRETDSDARCTPPEILELVAELWPEGITTDPAWNRDSFVEAETTYDRAEDGLRFGWCGRVFLNPPFSDPSTFLSVARHSVALGTLDELVAILPLDPSRGWWRRYVWSPGLLYPLFDHLCLLSVRPRFYLRRQRMGTPEFTCAIAYRGSRDFRGVFSKAGMVVSI